MNTREILKEALKLKPDEKFSVIETLLASLDNPDKNIDTIWTEEAEKRLKAHREGRLKGIPMEEVLK